MAFSNSFPTQSVSSYSSNDICPLKALFKYLEKVHGAVGECLEDNNNYPLCMFFQDSFMKDVFNFYPERICIDCTYKKFESNLFTLLFLCEDSNGINFIVAVAFLQYNDIESLTWLFTTFKKHNPNWRKIRYLAVDPAIEQWDLINEIFSSPFIIICSYHAIKTFRNNVNNADVFRNISNEQKNCAIELFKSLLYAMTEEEFNVILQKFQSLNEIIISYILQYWIPLKDKWGISLDFVHEDVFKNRNEYLEELDNAIQMIFESEENYIEFIKKIFLMISFKKRQRPSESLKPVSFLYSRFSPEHEICKALTPYAAQFVIKQLDLSQEMAMDYPLSESYTFIHLNTEVQACDTSCQCYFHLYTLLPCRHIFCVRRIKRFCSLFESTNVALGNWDMQYYQHVSTCMGDYLSNSIDNRIPQDLFSRATLASHLFEITFPILNDLPKPLYESRIKLLKNLTQAWEVDDDVSVKFLGVDKSLKKKTYTSKDEPLSNAKIHLIKCPINAEETGSISEEICSPTEDDNSHPERTLCVSSRPILQSTTVKNNTTTPTSKTVYSSSDMNVRVQDKLTNKMPFLQAENILEEKQFSEMDIDSSSSSLPSLVLPFEAKRSSRQRPVDVNCCLLSENNLNFNYILRVICSTKESCVNWLKSQGFLPASRKCMLCNGDMISKNLSRLNDGITWSCIDKTCIGKRSSIRAGTWFEASNFSLQQILLFTYMWVNQFSKEKILSELSISEVDYVKWDKFNRRVCEEFLNDDSPTVVQAGASDYKDPRNTWQQNHFGKNLFLEFLKDVAYFYNKDKEHNSLKSENDFSNVNKDESHEKDVCPYEDESPD